MELVTGPPALDEYLRLRAEAGLSPKTEAQGRGALENSWSFRHVRSIAGEAVAMGRVIGDGGWYFLIADMATLPTQQGKGLGRMILQSLLDEIRSRAPGESYVTLMGDVPGRRLYESVGFRDAMPDSLGMVMLLPPTP
jgi:GNAT superfamily N-acetyltransferase